MRERRSNSFVRERGLVSRRLLSTTLSPHPSPREFSIPNSRHETSKESVRRGMKGDSTDKAGRLRTVADRFFFAGQPSNFTTLPAFFLPLLLPSLLAPRPPLLSFAPELLQGSEESDEVAVYRYRPAGNSNLPLAPRLLLRLILN